MKIKIFVNNIAMPLLLKNRKYRKRRSKKSKSLSKRVSKLANFVYKTIETKYVDRGTNSHGLKTLSAVDFQVVPLTDMPDGTGATDDERIGDKVTLQSFQANLYIKNLTGTDYLRILVVQFDDLDTYIPSLDIPGILQYPTTTLAGDNMEPILSPYKCGPGKKFKILKDMLIKPLNQRQFNMNQASVFGNLAIKIHSKNCRKFNDQIRFLTGSSQSRPIQNGIAIYVGTNSDQLTTASMVQFTAQTRMKYKDA
jgi:hypothetical protein